MQPSAVLHIRLTTWHAIALAKAAQALLRNMKQQRSIKRDKLSPFHRDITFSAFSGLLLHLYCHGRQLCDTISPLRQGLF